MVYSCCCVFYPVRLELLPSSPMSYNDTYQQGWIRARAIGAAAYILRPAGEGVLQQFVKRRMSSMILMEATRGPTISIAQGLSVS